MMDSSAGKILQHKYARFHAAYDSKSRNWKILDAWHPSLESLSVGDSDSEIPDDSPAYTVVTDEMFTALMSEADRLGVLRKLVKDSVPNAESINLDSKPVESELVQVARIGLEKISSVEDNNSTKDKIEAMNQIVMEIVTRLK